MRVSGFTILRNGVRFAYPFEESIRSLLPLVDELHVGVGQSDDDSLNRVRAIDSPKVRIFETQWDLSQREGGRLLSDQTNLALARCDGDWCFYLQADEVLHEDDYEIIWDGMRNHLSRTRTLGIWFDYLHFMGDYRIRNALGYLSSVRIIRPGHGLRSIRDASKFGWSHSRPLLERRPWSRAKHVGARVFHYGYVRPPLSMADKDEWGKRLYDRGSLGAARPRRELTEWQFNFAACTPYHGTHPAVMAGRIAAKDWEVPPFSPVPLWRNSTFIKGRLRKAGLWPKRWTS
jgi:glycosyltransferase involved in cell wall biosynthesis